MINLYGNNILIATATLTTDDIKINKASIEIEAAMALGDGTYSLTTTWLVGKESAASSAFTLTVDTAATGAPSLKEVNDNVVYYWRIK